MIDKKDWKWFGTAGHFICGQWCRFHMATQVGKYFISTVGQYVHPRHSRGSEMNEREWLKENWPGEDVGYQRKYETMVFLAGEPCLDAQCGCGMPTISGSDLDFAGYNNAGDATTGHLAICEKWSKEP
jgi:hypothetical protein